jgi:hypothetical protein
MDGMGPNGLHLSGLIIAMLILAAWVLQEDPLQGQRPKPGDVPHRIPGLEQDVPARLWQDPFEAVRTYRVVKKSSLATNRLARALEGLAAEVDATTTHAAPIPAEPIAGTQEIGNGTENRANPSAAGSASAGETGPSDSAFAGRPSGSGLDAAGAIPWDPSARCKNTLYPRDAIHDIGNIVQQLVESRPPVAKKPHPVKLVLASISGSHWAEPREARLRTRYAMLTALLEQGYEPLANEHIGYWCVPQRGATERKVAPLIFPFETLVRSERDRTGSPDQSALILLLWVPEEAIHQGPLRKLAFLMKHLDANLRTKDLRLDEPAILIGPQGSSTLESLLEDACDTKADEVLTTGLRILSGTATRPTHHIKPDTCIGAFSGPRGQIELVLGKLVLFRTVVTDDELMKAVVEELALRDVRPATNQRDTVVLISELDTDFGRDLPELFVSAVKSEMGNESAAPTNILQIGYLRGLDGQIAQVTEKAQGKSETPARLLAIAEEVADNYTEPATGTSQYDYLRRLSTMLGEYDKRLRRQGQGRIRAFGVLGNDVYDKLLIFQALRERFPHQLYFTNDLDARLLAPDDYPWVRNLIIASSFGLRFEWPWQRQVPPFRSSYQSSIFLAT